MSALLEEVRESLSLPGPDVARQIREAAGVSQARLAEELGVHELTVHRWEARHAHPARGTPARLRPPPGRPRPRIRGSEGASE